MVSLVGGVFDGDILVWFILYYRSLAALLPPLLSYPSSDSPRLVRSSRIDEGGVLPFVPCTIMPYHTSSSISDCFTHKLATHSSFHIHFMGDSKIRELFYVFLERIDGKHHFNVKFSEGSPRKLRESQEVKQLARWASGEDPPPHLLVIGYAMWMAIMKRFVPFPVALSFPMEVHQVVVPLLHKISQRTHVLVVPQHRTRNHLDTSLNKGHQNYQTESNFDWSEMAFRHYLDRWSRGEGEASPLPRRQASATPVFMSRTSGMDLVAPSDALTHHNTTWALIEDEYLKQHVTKDEEMVQHVTEGEEVVQHVTEGEAVVQHVTEGEEVVQHVTEGEEVVQHVTEGEAVVQHMTEGEAVVQHVTEGEEVVQHVTEGEEVVQHVAADGVDQLSVRESGVGVWWWDTSLPLGLASIAECQQLYNLGLTLHPLYINKFLMCTDLHHAGTATLGDQVTMLLNLLCNSVLSVPKNACCH
ncbi:hypothetical protein Pcinc_028931 [Petrolisthes cinctipes]|uniref:Uncharacterized protein n=1 Tax=Petrolisthes cinctipes TaxID=88211 RepID=A0AAE1F144_PETCI|nr:hypothetical protein Pcinc_028931 [Petrolisthes cinctipes]